MSRIAILSHSHHAIAEPFAGGLEMHTALIARILASQGNDVTLFAKSGSRVEGCEIFEMVPEAFSFQGMSSTTFGGRSQVAQLRTYFSRALGRIENEGFDYVINNSLNGIPLEWKPRIPTLTIFHTPSFAGLVNSARMASRMPNHTFATVSHTNRRDWEQHVGKVEVVMNGIELSQWRSMQKKTDELRWSARITPEKGLHIAIAAARLSNRTLRFAGPISNPEYFEKMIKPELDDTVIYEGHLNHTELSAFLASGAAAVCTPMWEEPFGLSVVEAMASGTPVAALPRGAMPELINDHVGAVSTGVSAEALSVAIDEACEKNADDCRFYVEQNFDAKKMVAAYLTQLSQVPGGEADPAPQEVTWIA